MASSASFRGARLKATAVLGNQERLRRVHDQDARGDRDSCLSHLVGAHFISCFWEVCSSLPFPQEKIHIVWDPLAYLGMALVLPSDFSAAKTHVLKS